MTDPTSPFSDSTRRPSSDEERNLPLSGASAPDSPPASGKTVVPPPKPRPVRRFFRRMMLILILLAVIGSALWAWVTVSMAYATTEKAGFVQSLSKQGWLCKTWEGQLAVSPAPGMAPEVFAFTIRNDSIANALRDVLPQRVAITYEEHRGVPSSCFGETQNYVIGFRTVE